MSNATIARADSGVVKAIDLFCGFGGSSQGIHAAGADVIGAANHNELAIQCHAANYPDTDHWRADLSNPDRADYVDPATLPPATFLWASPSCKYHSIANARKLYMEGPQGQLFGDGEPFDHERYAASERSRVSMLCPLRYAAKQHPEIVVIENVVEAAHWGPNRDGSTFRWWLKEWESIGYRHEELFLNSMFFPPCPQSRDRMYVVFWRDGNTRPDLDFHPKACCTSDACQGRIVEAVQWWNERTAAWPLPKWGKYRTQYVYKCPDCRATVEPLAWPAYTAIDWNNLGIAIGDRASLGMKPLADTTMERIRRGLTKFRGGPPVLVPSKALYGTDKTVLEPLATQTTQQERALIVEQGMVVPLRTHGSARNLLGELPTQVAGNVGTAFVVAGQSNDADGNRSRHPGEQLFTVSATGSPGGVAFVVKNNGDITEAGYRAKSVGEPLGAITASPTQSVVTEGIHLPVNGNAHERPGQTRARPITDPLFTLAGTQHFGFAHQPAVVSMRGGGSHESGQRSILDSLDTVSAGGFHHGLMSPALWQKINRGPGDTAWHTVDDPLNTITGRDTTGLVVLPWLDQWRSNPAAISDQMATVMSHLRHALAVSEWDETPVTDDDLQAVRFRMLEPDPELRRAMAFGDDYVLLGNKSQMTSGLGNAVTPTVASAITERCMATLGGAS